MTHELESNALGENIDLLAGGGDGKINLRNFYFRIIRFILGMKFAGVMVRTVLSKQSSKGAYFLGALGTDFPCLPLYLSVCFSSSYASFSPFFSHSLYVSRTCIRIFEICSIQYPIPRNAVTYYGSKIFFLFSPNALL
jgi:hypothetical protein